MASSLALPKDLTIGVANAFDDPVEFVHRILRHKTWSKHEELLRSGATNPLTAVKGCHASTKTFASAELVLYFLARAYVREHDAIVITLGPTARQVRLNVWKEIRKALQGSLVGFPEPNQMELTIAEKIYAVGFGVRADKTGSGAIRLQGLHATEMLIVVDEAPGIESEIWQSIEGLRAGGKVHVVVLGNPNVPSGKFYEIFTHERDRWHCITIDALDTPNLVGLSLEDIARMPTDVGGPLDEKAVDYPVVSRRWVREMFDTVGEDNPEFESRVRGRFPQQAEGALIPLAWLEAAKWKDVVKSNQRLTSGIDVAEEGEAETVLYILDRGHVVTPPVISRNADSRGDVAAGLEPFRGQMGDVRYDSIGVGAYFGKHFRDLNYSVVPINVGRASSEPKRFPRLRDQLYWEMREQFERGNIAGLEDELTIAQCASLRYENLPDGRTKVEGKKEMRKRGSRSPDRAEGLMLACTVGGGGGGSAGPVVRRRPSILERDI